jgi:hypothetical protein
MLKAADDIHTPSFDTVRVNVGTALIANVHRDGQSVRVDWSGPVGSYTVEAAAEITGEWKEAATLTATNFVVPEVVARQFYRVRRN